MMRNDFGRTLLSFSFSGPPNPGSTNATWPHLSHSTRVSSFSIFICLAFSSGRCRTSGCGLLLPSLLTYLLVPADVGWRRSARLRYRGRWALHPSLTRPSLRSSDPGLHRDGRALGLDLDRRASNGPLLDGRLGLETVDATEGVENACWCISRVHERACR